MNDMFLKFSAPFIKSTKNTFSTMMSTTITMHSPQIKTDNQAGADITALIGINGTVHSNGQDKEFRGLLALCFSKAIYLKLASRMLGEDYTEMVPDIADAGSEVANIILGGSKQDLLNMGIKLQLTSPSTIRGTDHEISYPKGSTTMRTTVTCDLGDFYLDLCYQDVKF
jgi:chemotaxis protein CheX